MRDETVSNLSEILGDRYDDVIDKAMTAPRLYATRQYTLRDRVADMLATVLPGLLALHRAEADELRAMLAGRCLSDITHRDDEHRQSVCMLPAEHAPLMHDDCMGCTWTDADHWQPPAVDRVADLLAEAWDEGADFVVRHPGMSAEYTRAANPFNPTATSDGKEPR